jgi:PPM family protein phosphatase
MSAKVGISVLGRLQHLFIKKYASDPGKPDSSKPDTDLPANVKPKDAQQPEVRGALTQPLELFEESGEKPLPGYPIPVITMEPPQILAACGQSTGLQRDHNEDALFTLTTNLISDTRHIRFGLYIVADGMGGHQNGEVASAAAIRTMAGYVLRKIYLPLFSNTAIAPEESLQEIMGLAVLDAHKFILKQAVGGGTTLTAALVLGDQMTIAHVGDSRAYAIHQDGKMELLTRDHSLVKRLEELGQITTDEAAVHPQRNVLYRALGQGEPLEPDIVTAHIPENGFILLCSDGLWGVVEEEKILEIIASASSPDQACHQMIQAANEAGGPDNISAILAYIPSG